MSRVHIIWRTGIVVMLTACADAPTAAPEGTGTGGDLALLLPTIERAALVSQDRVELDAHLDASVPVAAEIAPNEQPDGDYPSPPADAVAAIWEARTYADFQPGYGRATGQHSYQGNKSRIETTVTVSFEGSTLGSQSAFTESDAFLWYYLGQARHLFASARFYTDRTCDLTAVGNSVHRAWMESVIGSAVSRFGEAAQSSTSDVARQPACPDDDYSFPGGGSGSMLCYFWIEYDEYTGHVYSVDLLYCEGLGG